MDLTIMAILAQDGITTGAIYALLALALVLVFSVTRVIFIPQGEYVAFGALTLAAVQAGHFPHTATLLLGLGIAVFFQDSYSIFRSVERRASAGRSVAISFAKFIVFPLLMFLAARSIGSFAWPTLLQVIFTLAVIMPMGPLIYRLAYQPVAEASTLVLLIVSVGVHFALLGIGLVMFGAEGFRTQPFWDASFQFNTLSVSGQSITVIGVALLLMVVLYLYFDRTLSGKALRATAVNRVGARLLGIGTTQAGRLAFTFAAALGALCGVLIAPLTTIYYDSGFLIGLKGFVGAIIGGLGSYPIAAAGSLLVGLLESYSSFWASAFKEVIVFTLIIPVLLWRSLAHPHVEEGDE
jgi:branched-chain amino acid transport system permease protein